jgi:hypothetical protein
MRKIVFTLIITTLLIILAQAFEVSTQFTALMRIGASIGHGR